MISQLRPALVLLTLFTLLTGFAYPYATTGLAHLLFPHQADGSLIEKDGHVVGSALIGQNFTADNYFHSRPSATTDTDPNDSTKTVPAPYNAANSAGSNAGPTSKSFLEGVQANVDALKKERSDVAPPVDLVTASASGLDPHISPAAAEFQVPRVATARGLTADAVRTLITAHTTPRWLGLFGEPAVNVLDLNLALDAAQPKPAAP
jgi:K+-transporting ATPase ATPase C chain